MVDCTDKTVRHVCDHVMIDIETMSLHKHKALILSIGMIEFDPVGDDLFIGERETILPDIVHQIALGRQVSKGTQKFWAEQSAEARFHWSMPRERATIADALSRVRKFCRGKSHVWANGTQFDLCNLEGLAEDIDDADELWHYRAPRDMRTFVKVVPQTRRLHTELGPEFKIVPHEPISDCIWQAHQIWQRWPDTRGE